MRTFRNLTIEDLDQYMPIYLHAYPAYKTLDEEGRSHYRNRIKKDMTLDTDVDFIGLFEEDEMIALMKVIHFSMNVYGKMQKATGLMSLAVHPLHKKKKAAFEMVQYYEKYSQEKGANIFALLPFNINFYRQMGYGLGSKIDEYHIPTNNLPKSNLQANLIFITNKERILQAYNEKAEKIHGMFKKFDEEKRALLEDQETLHIAYVKDNKISSYASYHFESTHPENYTQTRIVVDELIYDSAQELRELLEYFRRQADLAQSILIRTSEEDFYHLLQDPQDLSLHYIPYGYLQTNVSAMANMYKIHDFTKFVQDTSYRKFPYTNLVIALEAYNEITKETEKIKIEFTGHHGQGYSHWSPSDKEAQVKISAKKGDLSSLLLNSIRFSSLIGLGLGTIDKEEYIDQIDRLLYYPQKPFSNNDY